MPETLSKTRSPRIQPETETPDVSGLTAQQARPYFPTQTIEQVKDKRRGPDLLTLPLNLVAYLGFVYAFYRMATADLIQGGIILLVSLLVLSMRGLLKNDTA